MIDDGSIQILNDSMAIPNIPMLLARSETMPAAVRRSLVPHLDGIHLATPREEDVINELSPLLRAFTMDFLATKNDPNVSSRFRLRDWVV